MGVSFDENLRIAGYRPTVFKSALQGFLRTEDPGAMVDLKTVFPTRRDGAIVFEECLDRGLIIAKESGKLEVSEAGLVIAAGKAARRTPLRKARQVLEGLLDRADTMNRHSDAVQTVEKIWLYGSMVRDQPDVGDIDLAIVTSKREVPFDRLDVDGEEDEDDVTAHSQRVLRRYGLAVPGWRSWAAPGELTRLMLFGPRRHPLLAGAQMKDRDLRDMGVPCRLIYDRSRGGRVNDAILPRHPDSPGRRNDIHEPAPMPSLSPAAIRPMNAAWASEYRNGYRVLPGLIYRGDTAEEEELFPYRLDHVSVFAGRGISNRPCEWVPDLVSDPTVDGRNRVVLSQLMDRNPQWRATSIRRGLAVAMDRSIRSSASGWTIHVRFGDLETWRGHKRAEILSVCDLARVASLILTGDTQRIVRRDQEDGLERPLTIDIDGADEGGRSVAVIVAGLLEHCQQLVAPSWAGPAPTVLAPREIEAA